MGILSSIVKGVERRLGKSVVKTGAKDAAVKTTSNVGMKATSQAITGGKTVLRMEAEKAALSATKGVTSIAKPAAITAGVVGLTAGTVLVGNEAYSRLMKSINTTSDTWATEAAVDVGNQSADLAERWNDINKGIMASGGNNPYGNSVVQPESTASAIKGTVGTAAIAGVVIAAIVAGTMIYKASKKGA